MRSKYHTTLIAGRINLTGEMTTRHSDHSPARLSLDRDLAGYLGPRDEVAPHPTMVEALISVENTSAAESAICDPTFVEGVARLNPVDVLAGSFRSTGQGAALRSPLVDWE